MFRCLNCPSPGSKCMPSMLILYCDKPEAPHSHCEHTYLILQTQPSQLTAFTWSQQVTIQVLVQPLSKNISRRSLLHHSSLPPSILHQSPPLSLPPPFPSPSSTTPRLPPPPPLPSPSLLHFIFHMYISSYCSKTTSGNVWLHWSYSARVTLWLHGKVTW